VKSLNHYYGNGNLRQQVLFDIELTINPGEFVIMTGPSGSGKSTLLSLIGCLRSVQEGSLQVLGQQLKGMNDAQRTRIRRNFGYIFQASNLLSFLTVERNIATSLKLQGIRDRQTRRRYTIDILESVGLTPQLKSYPRQLSGGQKQRAAIAGALVTQPKLVLADEPTAALDSQTGRQTIELIHRLAKEQGSAVLMVTHDPRILDVADRIIQVEDGRLGLAYSQEISLALPGLREDQIKAMDIKPDLLTYEAGSIVFREGDPSDRFYMVLQGRVEAFHGEVNQRRILNTMGRGQYFGEIGLLDSASRRSASIRVTDDAPAKLMSIAGGDFKRLMGGSNLTEVAIAQTLQDRLKRTAITGALPTLDVEAIEAILPQIEQLRYGSGSNILRAGDLSDYFYIVLTGQVDVITPDNQGRQRVISVLGPGEYFGEIGLFGQRQRTATVRASLQSAVELMALPQAAFQQLLQRSEATHQQIANTVYERLKKDQGNTG
ncbi:MAG: cyclic nucleotide-binding domain-containing protein, partial [Cyanobacteria bacterium P01_F01_bin.153]